MIQQHTMIHTTNVGIMTDGYRLSPQQTRLWQLHSNSECSAYRVQCDLTIEGDLDIAVLTRALEAVIHKYEILRTTFAHAGDLTAPSQVIRDAVARSIDYHDLSSYDPAEQQSAAQMLLGRIGLKKFDLSNGPLLQVALLKLSVQKHLLTLALPALCSDSRSLEFLIGEIGRTYETLIRNGEPDDGAVQYADIAEVLNQILESEETDLGRAYWSRQDFSALTALKAPFETSALPDSTFAPARAGFNIAPDKAAIIEQASSALGVTVDVLFLACWQALVWRLTGQADVIIGRLFDGRTSEEFTGTLGTFARYLPLRSDMKPDLRFADVARRTAELTRNLTKWQEYFSWDLLQGLARGGPEPLFFPVCFDFESEPESVSLAGLSWRTDDRYACIDRFKLRLLCVRKGDSLICEIHYDPAYLMAEDALRLGRYYEAILDGALEDGGALIEDLEILPERERNQLLAEFSGRDEKAVTLLFHETVEQNVRRAADRTAVSFDDHHLSYGELNKRANKLAHYLAILGVGPETVVGLCSNASRELIIGLLGVLKAGAAYLPLDPTLPAERLAFMLNDAEVPVLLSGVDDLADRINYAGRIVHLEREWEIVAACRDDNPSVPASGENLAYVIFTSGSTGRPKGVLVQRGGLANLPMGQVGAYDVQPESRVLQFASIGFDASISEVAMALARSAILCLASRDAMLPGPSLITLLKERAITTVTLPPTVLAVLSDADLPALRTIIAAGEACPAEVVTRWASGRLFCNGYGPTEATVCATIARCGISNSMPSIGRPMTNVRVYIVDQKFRPVPFGVAGELFIGGAGLSRGYLGRPELTAENWVPNPFGDPGSRLYKSGDRARWLADGNIEFLGRIDHQVKIRGFRIELGEIEAVLREHPDLKTAVVLAQGNEPAGLSLVAYLVPKPDSINTVNSLRRYLQERLPAHLVPAFFVEVDDIPLTKSGKVDREALTKKNRMMARSESTYVMPSRHTERQIATVWQDILGVENVGIHDNFFDLGGHSLLMVRIHSKLEQLIGREIPMIDLFEHPTISALAQHLSRDNVEEHSPEPEDLAEKRRKGKDRLQQRFRQRREREEPIGGRL